MSDTTSLTTGASSEASNTTQTAQIPTTPRITQAADKPMRAAKPPVGIGSAPLVGQLIALALVALGVVGIQETLSRTGLITQDSWTTTILDALDGLAADSPVVLIVAITAAALGLFLLPIAFLRRPRTSVALAATTGVYLRRKDLAPILATAIEGTEAITDTRIKVKPRKVTIKATTLASRDRAPEVKTAIDQRVASTLAALEKTPKTRIVLRHQEGTR